MSKLNIMGINFRLTDYAVRLLLLSSLIIAALPAVARAETAVNLSLSASTTSTTVGNDVTVTLNASTSGNMLDARVRVAYDAGKLTFSSVSYSGSPLDQDFGSAGGTGYYTIDRYKLGGPYPSGSFTLAKLTFKTKAAGTASISIAGSPETTVGLESGDSVALGLNNTAIAVSEPPAAQQQTNNQTQNNTNTQNTNNSSSSGSRSNTTTTNTTSNGSAAEQGVPDDEPIPVAAENETNDPGYAVAIRVTDKDGNPKQGVKVSLDEKEATTDESGVVTFEGLVAGTYDIYIDGEKKQITVVEGDKVETQSFDFELNEKASNLLQTLLLAAGLLALVGLIAFSFLKIKKKPFSFKKNSPMNGATLPVPQPQQETLETKLEMVKTPDGLKPESVVDPQTKDQL